MTESFNTTCVAYTEGCESLMVVDQWQSIGCSDQKSWVWFLAIASFLISSSSTLNARTIRDHKC